MLAMALSGYSRESRLAIRTSTEPDLPGIDLVHLKAFGSVEGLQLADLARELLRDETARACLSPVAESGDPRTGHVLFTAARVDGPGERPVACASVLNRAEHWRE